MHVTRVYIEGFKRFTKFDLELSPTFNVIVGDNETGNNTGRCFFRCLLVFSPS
ncbi:MAG TPA: hypothetical protein VF579_10445 [Candidatus Methylomirabilis sp.]